MSVDNRENLDIFNRVNRLVGSGIMQAIGGCRAVVFGVGGVGSWTAEALVRSGVGHITIVDADTVAASNVNRQLMATTSTIGQSKVEVLARRLKEINPDVAVDAREVLYTADTACQFDLDGYDYVIDAIDSLAHKALLIRRASASRATLFSSMGAAMKMDPTRIGVAEFWKVKGCPLAAALRRKFKKSGEMPRRKFRCVYSDELLPNLGEADDATGAMTFDKVALNGAMCHITAIFGMTLAGLVMEDIYRKSKLNPYQ